MEFTKYQHVERLGTTETNGIEMGMCYIFPKIDGTNSQLWFENGLQAGSRNRHLEVENDNAGFYMGCSKIETRKGLLLCLVMQALALAVLIVHNGAAMTSSGIRRN